MKNNKKRLINYISIVVALFFCMLLSISIGSRDIPFEAVLKALVNELDDSTTTAIIQARIPRTVFGILVGAMLGISGNLMQSITRNPIADPSILGVNTGASLAVVIGMAFLGIESGNKMIMLAFAGALLSAFAVYGIAAIGSGGASPMKLALAGAAVTTALSSFVSTIMLPNAQVMKSFRFWQVGSVAGATISDVKLIMPYCIIGTALALAITPSLNALALGDEMAITLGIRVNRTRFLAAIAGILLCASTTALAGPIGFVGLMVPHIVRLIFGADLKFTLPMSALCGAILLLVSDIIGRVVIRPAELEVGIITALLGAPIFIIIVRKAKLKSL